MPENLKSIPVVCEDAWKKYGGKAALFRVIIDGKTHTRIGEFMIHQNPTRINLLTTPALDGQVGSSEIIHLSQEAVDSILPIPNVAEYAFVVFAPLENRLFRERKK
jgi:hypothetical protein